MLPLKLQRLTQALREGGLWAERHSYSIRIMYHEKFVASLHLYPLHGEAVMRLYSDEEPVNDYVLNAVRKALQQHFPELRLHFSKLKRPRLS
ncbi:MAG: hypothetical protein ABWK00_03400 [Desulfurococcaceae archaeon]